MRGGGKKRTGRVCGCEKTRQDYVRCGREGEETQRAWVGNPGRTGRVQCLVGVVTKPMVGSIVAVDGGRGGVLLLLEIGGHLGGIVWECGGIESGSRPGEKSRKSKSNPVRSRIFKRVRPTNNAIVEAIADLQILLH